MRREAFNEQAVAPREFYPADVQALNVRKTPSFFVNGQPLKNFGLDELKTLVADEIKVQYGS